MSAEPLVPPVDNIDDSSWTGAVRRCVARRLPLAELLPTHQPEYVRSWVYLFGAITIAALTWVVGSGIILAFFGPQWWHQSSVGRFFNSLHFWGVQVFFLFMVLHLWGQFWGAGWRHGRAATWVVGVATFLVGIVAAFTGYISQQNFDAQWIAINAKDAVNASGIGAFFNPLNFGQAYGVHVMLLPVAVIMLVAVHIGMVRMKGVVRPVDAPPPAAPTSESSLARPGLDKAGYYRDIRMAPYDLVRELAIAAAGVLAVIIILAAVLSSPDMAPVTIASWANADPVDFVTTAVSELAGSSTSAQYGPPYNNGDSSVQSLWFVKPQSWAGVHQSVDAANQFVVQPLQQAAVGDSALTAALSTFEGASSDEQGAWLDAYTKALGDAKLENEQIAVAPGDYGPIPVLMKSLLMLARSGGLDGLLLASDRFYATDYTRPLLFMGDGSYLAGLAQDQKLTGNQWGMMNDTGQYPGQAWLWLYTIGYQIRPFNQEHGFLGINSANADLAITVTMAILTSLLVLVPFVPGLRDIPRWIPIHRLIWRRYYSELEQSHELQL